MENKKLTMREAVYCSIGDITVSVYLQLIALFAIVFYIDALGIFATLVGLTFMGSRVLDGINDITVGYISDRYSHYKRRALYGSIVTAVAFVIMFTDSHLSMKMQSVYAPTAFYFWTLMHTCYAIPFNASASTMTQNIEERILFNSTRSVIVAAPSPIVSLATPYLKSGIQGSNSIYGNIALVFTVTATVYTLICAAGTVERAKAPIAGRHTSGKEYLKAILKDRQLLVVSAASFCGAFGHYIYPPSMAYYLNYYPGSARLMGVVLGISTLISVVAALYVTPMSRHMGKKKVLMGCDAIFALSSVIRYLMSLNTVVVAVTCWTGMFVMSVTPAISFTMIADTTDYGMRPAGKNVRAVNYGFCTFYQKIGVAFSGTIAGILLDMAGYVPNQQQTDVVLRGILSVYCLIPAAIHLIMTILMLPWKLDEGRMHEIMAELGVRRYLETND